MQKEKSQINSLLATMFISDENSVEELMMTHLQFTQDVYLLKESVINSNIKSVIKSSIVFVLNKIMKNDH
ncbi:hypothetical protein KGR20_12455 [Cytobacillus oceanisediminis]|uniref:hypothetical protein n=1 Tax=Cytobacillus oceanisediminis TaxID=665099 RepID=UPI001CC980B8|nr:hypothetical protein [Cytobacillus oceanisediminis]MBZ9535054.1 hypothetical protein [Cytobacillus oceanisediminis]